MLTYTIGEGDFKNWLVGEEEFLVHCQGKGESIFCLANGYMGIRSAYEEDYPYQTRGMFVSGCFNSSQGETIEIPNSADVCGMQILLDGEMFSMRSGVVSEYRRYLNLYTGELVRSMNWLSPAGKSYRLLFRRSVSKADKHAYGIRVEITAADNVPIPVQMISGINARMTNSGVQHFLDGTKRVLNNQYLFLEQTTTQSEITYFHCCGTRVSRGSRESRSFAMSRRKIDEAISFEISAGETGVIEKLGVLYTSRDLVVQDEEQAKDLVVMHLQKLIGEGYEGMFQKSASAYQAYWEKNDIQIVTSNSKIQLALRFAQYHLQAMIPEDSRSSIAAKGLTGEGYKGHVFWDTEVFILPYYLFHQPEKARQLLEYRVKRIDQARQNARDRHFQGLMFPWESAETGAEETPVFASMDIITGEAANVWAGMKEHHITADIAYAAWQYWLATGDQRFMESGGKQLIIGAALFWLSRSTYVPEQDRYEILDIIGPDEYTEHVDNNAYSNYLAYDITALAVQILAVSEAAEIRQYEEMFDTNGLKEKLETFAAKLYRPKADQKENRILPQDDTFLDKEIIDISEYRKDNIKQTILKKYSREQVNDMQVLKQSDVIMLMELLPDLFEQEFKWENWQYYEPKTIHDSSLSQAIYSVVACDCRKADQAYQSFLHAIDIDMGQNPYSSDEGIHAASMGGIWLAVIRGFAGVRLTEEGLVIQPCLPDEITSIRFHIYYKGRKLELDISHTQVKVHCREDGDSCLIINGSHKLLKKELYVDYS